MLREHDLNARLCMSVKNKQKRRAGAKQFSKRFKVLLLGRESPESVEFVLAFSQPMNVA